MSKKPHETRPRPFIYSPVKQSKDETHQSNNDEVIERRSSQIKTLSIDNKNENVKQMSPIKCPKYYPGKSILKKRWLSLEPESPRTRCAWWLSELKEVIKEKKKQIMQKKNKKSNENDSNNVFLKLL